MVCSLYIFSNMRSWITAVGAAWSLAATVVHGKEFIEGNWYEAEQKHLQYDFGKSGSYMEITSMDKESGKCESKKKEYGGPLGVFGEEV